MTDPEIKQVEIFSREYLVPAFIRWLAIGCLLLIAGIVIFAR